MQPLFDHLNSQDLIGQTDQVALAGAIKSLAQDPQGEEAQLLLKQIELSSTLHGIDTLILMNHTDCGGYGGRSAFDSLESERQKHMEDMSVARDLIQAQHPNLQIKTTLADMQEDGTVQFVVA